MNELQPSAGSQGILPNLRNWAGKKIELFTAGTLFSLRRHNERTAALNALLNPKISPPTAGQIIIADDSIMFQLNGSGGGPGGGITQITSVDGSVTITPAPGTGPIVDLSVNSGALLETAFVSFGFSGDYSYITCTGGTKVRLPPLLRFTVASRTVYGVTIHYNNYNPTQQSRTASSGGFDITQYITPQYVPGDLVYASKVGGVLQDLNVDGRVFAGP